MIELQTVVNRNRGNQGMPLLYIYISEALCLVQIKLLLNPNMSFLPPLAYIITYADENN